MVIQRILPKESTEMCNRDLTLPEEWGEGCQKRPFQGTELGNGVVVGGEDPEVSVKSVYLSSAHTCQSRLVLKVKLLICLSYTSSPFTQPPSHPIIHLSIHLNIHLCNSNLSYGNRWDRTGRSEREKEVL